MDISLWWHYLDVHFTKTELIFTVNNENLQAYFSEENLPKSQDWHYSNMMELLKVNNKMTEWSVFINNFSQIQLI